MSEDDKDERFCSNCKKHIASVNFVMHEMHCRRHIILCKICGEPVPKSEEEEHFTTYHAEVECQLCKMKVEKDKLDVHTELECRSKPVNCPYCEMEMPHCDLGDHESYCGTRTEPCANCDQYIMIKDFNRHLDSGCQYPTPKPHNPSSAVNIPNVYSDHIDPFTMDEISRILEETAVPEAQFGTANRFHTPPRHIVRNNTTDRSRKNTTNRKSEVNKQKELSSSASPNTRYDSMLSQMLGAAHDSPENISQFMEALQKQTERPTRRSVSESSDSENNLNTFDDDDLLPCEFCGEPFSADVIIQHQSGCDPMASGHWMPTNPSESQNNEIQPTTIQRSTAFIPVINNLESTRVQQWTDLEEDSFRAGEVFDDEDPIRDNILNDELYQDVDMAMLPCEFCTDLFPQDSLVLHQAICDANTTVTPRVITPAAGYQPKLKPKHNRSTNYVSDNLFNSSRSNRHQAAPSGLDVLDYETMQNNNICSDQVYNRSDLFTNGHSVKPRSDSIGGNQRSNGAIKKSSRQRNTSHTQDVIDNLLQEDLNFVNRESAKKSETRSKVFGASGGTAAIMERSRKPASVSARKVVKELEKNSTGSPNQAAAHKRTRTRRTDESKESTPSTVTRQRSTHLLNADSPQARIQASSQTRLQTLSKSSPSTTKPSNLPRR